MTDAPQTPGTRLIRILNEASENLSVVFATFTIAFARGAGWVVGAVYALRVMEILPWK